jgi:hypothetical protein
MNTPKGWHTPHPAGADHYVFLNNEFRIYSQDEGEDEMRFGVISYFVKKDGHVLAVTLFQLFAKSWNPQAGMSYDAREHVLGKKAFRFKWADPAKSKNKSSDKALIKEMGEFGTVIHVSQPCVVIKVNPRIAEAEEFLQGGYWMKLAQG